WEKKEKVIVDLKTFFSPEIVSQAFVNDSLGFIAEALDLISANWENLKALPEFIDFEVMRQSFASHPSGFARAIKVISENWNSSKKTIIDLKILFTPNIVNKAFEKNAFGFAKSLEVILANWEGTKTLTELFTLEAMKRAFTGYPFGFAKSLELIFANQEEFKALTELLTPEAMSLAFARNTHGFVDVLKLIFANKEEFKALTELLTPATVRKAFVSGSGGFIDALKPILEHWNDYKKTISDLQVLFTPETVNEAFIRDPMGFANVNALNSTFEQWNISQKTITALTALLTPDAVSQAFAKNPFSFITSLKYILSDWEGFKTRVEFLPREVASQAFAKDPSGFASALELTFINRKNRKETAADIKIFFDSGIVSRIFASYPFGFAKIFQFILADTNWEKFETIFPITREETFDQGVAALRQMVAEAGNDYTQYLNALSIASFVVQMQMYASPSAKTLGPSEIAAASLKFINHILDPNQKAQYGDFEILVKKYAFESQVFSSDTTSGGKIHLTMNPSSEKAVHVASLVDVLGSKTQSHSWTDSGEDTLEIHLFPSRNPFVLTDIVQEFCALKILGPLDLIKVEKGIQKPIPLQPALLVNGLFWDENDDLEQGVRSLALAFLLTNSYPKKYAENIPNQIDTCIVVNGGGEIYGDAAQEISGDFRKARADLVGVIYLVLEDLKGNREFDNQWQRWNILGNAMLAYLKKGPKTPLEEKLTLIMKRFLKYTESILRHKNVELYEGFSASSWKRGNWSKVKKLLELVEEKKFQEIEFRQSELLQLTGDEELLKNNDVDKPTLVQALVAMEVGLAMATQEVLTATLTETVNDLKAKNEINKKDFHNDLYNFLDREPFGFDAGKLRKAYLGLLKEAGYSQQEISLILSKEADEIDADEFSDVVDRHLNKTNDNLGKEGIAALFEAAYGSGQKLGKGGLSISSNLAKVRTAIEILKGADGLAQMIRDFVTSKGGEEVFQNQPGESWWWGKGNFADFVRQELDRRIKAQFNEGLTDAEFGELFGYTIPTDGAKCRDQLSGRMGQENYDFAIKGYLKRADKKTTIKYFNMIVAPSEFAQILNDTIVKYNGNRLRGVNGLLRAFFGRSVTVQAFFLMRSQKKTLTFILSGL
ncbi:MAG: hypothetical protein NT079_04325, partial [Candidatus Omnitrophica bacterium]|nr:hypothetical protein [Candidatus Omnitrophota bacterium]